MLVVPCASGRKASAKEGPLDRDGRGKAKSNDHGKPAGFREAWTATGVTAGAWCTLPSATLRAALETEAEGGPAALKVSSSGRALNHQKMAGHARPQGLVPSLLVLGRCQPPRS